MWGGSRPRRLHASADRERCRAHARATAHGAPLPDPRHAARRAQRRAVAQQCDEVGRGMERVGDDRAAIDGQRHAQFALDHRTKKLIIIGVPFVATCD